MPLDITLLNGQTKMAMYTAPTRIYLNEDRSKVVPEEQASYLLVGKGGQIPMELAMQYGLVETEEKAVEPKSDKSVSKFRNK